jgi:tRNA pseudouridine38-40 synthase
MRLKLTIQYNGQPYGGWQHQLVQGGPKLPSVQGVLCAAFNQLLGTHTLQPAELVAAGRTDAGVHAWGQVVHVDLPNAFTTRAPHSWVTGLNRFLPLSIRVIAAEQVPEDFHARFGAHERHYVYRLWLGRQMRPDLLHFAGHLVAATRNLQPQLALAQQAIASLPIGTPTDFTSFKYIECQSKSPICTLTHASLTAPEPLVWELKIGANRFLHHMVRNLVGTLAQVATAERDPDLSPLLAAKNRNLAGPTFAPDGLYLTQVLYPDTDPTATL